MSEKKSEWHQELGHGECLYVCSCGAIQWIGPEDEKMSVRRFYSELKEIYFYNDIFLGLREQIADAITNEMVEMNYNFWPDDNCIKHLTEGSIVNKSLNQDLMFPVPDDIWQAHWAYMEWKLANDKNFQDPPMPPPRWKFWKKDTSK